MKPPSLSALAGLTVVSVAAAGITQYVRISSQEDEAAHPARPQVSIESTRIPCSDYIDLYARLTGPWSDPGFQTALEASGRSNPPLAPLQEAYDAVEVQELHHSLCTSSHILENIRLRAKPGRREVYGALQEQVASDRLSCCASLGPEWVEIETLWVRWSGNNR